jgi:hypothetical protein
MSPTEPNFDPDDHYDGVIRRGQRLRNRRRALVAAGGLAVVGLMVAGVALAAGGGRSPGRGVVTVGRPPAGTAATATSQGSSTTESSPDQSLPALTTTLGPTSPTSPAGPTTTRAGHPVATTTQPTTTVTTRPTPTTSAYPACTAAQLEDSTVTDRSSYALGDPVAVTLVVRNVSGQTCSGPSASGIGATAIITHDGVRVATIAGPAIMCSLPCLPPVLAPGAITSYSAGEWLATGASAGAYQVVASRLATTAAPTAFTVS